MALSWNEIKHRAIEFSKEWEKTSNELADAKPFLIDFFNVFGIIQKKVASFEYRIKKLDEHDGYIDMLWKGTLLVEMKSRGKNLDKAYQQARDYLYGLKQFELPNYILVYNNFPWPEAPGQNQLNAIEKAAHKVLEVRSRFPESSLADLYDPLSMPHELVKVHQKLDKVVDLAYRPQLFPNDIKRMEYLFELYEKYTAWLFKTEKSKRKKK